MTAPGAQTVTDWRPTRQERWGFLAVTLIGYLLATQTATLTSFPYDARGYYYTVGAQGSWTFTEIASPLRGYVPLVGFASLRELADALGVSGFSFVSLFNAALVGWLASILLPRIAMLTWPTVEFGVGRRLLIGGILLVFWNGYIGFPLTDLPSLVAAIAAILLVCRSERILGLLVGGIAVGLAMNLRPAYLLLALGVLALAFLVSPDTRATRKGRWVRVAVVAAGFAVVSVPQMLIHHRQFGIWSPLPGAANDLTGFQLTTSLRLQRYDTYLGSEGNGPAMNYRDPAGEALVRPEDLTAESGGRQIDGFRGYLRIALRHPIEMANVGLRHLVNGLDQRYSTPYPTNLDTGQRRPFRVVGFLLVFLALVRLLWPAARRTLGKARWLPMGVLAAATIPSLPSAVEQRFLLPLFVIAVLLVVAPGWREALAVRRGRALLPAAAGLAAGFLVFAFVVIDITRGATDNQETSSTSVIDYPWPK